MCIYDKTTFVCTGEHITLVKWCPFPWYCLPHIRHTFRHSGVCRLCKIAGLQPPTWAPFPNTVGDAGTWLYGGLFLPPLQLQHQHNSSHVDDPHTAAGEEDGIPCIVRSDAEQQTMSPGTTATVPELTPPQGFSSVNSDCHNAGEHAYGMVGNDSDDHTVTRHSAGSTDTMYHFACSNCHRYHYGGAFAGYSPTSAPACCAQPEQALDRIHAGAVEQGSPMYPTGEDVNLAPSTAESSAFEAYPRLRPYQDPVAFASFCIRMPQASRDDGLLQSPFALQQGRPLSPSDDVDVTANFSNSILQQGYTTNAHFTVPEQEPSTTIDHAALADARAMQRVLQISRPQLPEQTVQHFLVGTSQSTPSQHYHNAPSLRYWCSSSRRRRNSC